MTREELNAFLKETAERQQRELNSMALELWTIRQIGTHGAESDYDEWFTLREKFASETEADHE